jgi:hypothetical protein
MVIAPPRLGLSGQFFGIAKIISYAPLVAGVAHLADALAEGVVEIVSHGMPVLFDAGQAMLAVPDIDSVADAVTLSAQL